MQLTRDEWKRHAEIAAAHKHGENHVGWYVFRRYGAVPVAVLVTAGALGLGVRWIWRHVSLPGTGGGSLSTPFWALLVALIVGTFVAFRPTATVRPAASILVRATVLGLLWLGFLAYAITVVI